MTRTDATLRLITLASVLTAVLLITLRPDTADQAAVFIVDTVRATWDLIVADLAWLPNLLLNALS